VTWERVLNRSEKAPPHLEEHGAPNAAGCDGLRQRQPGARFPGLRGWGRDTRGRRGSADVSRGGQHVSAGACGHEVFRPGGEPGRTGPGRDEKSDWMFGSGARTGSAKNGVGLPGPFAASRNLECRPAPGRRAGNWRRPPSRGRGIPFVTAGRMRGTGEGRAGRFQNLVIVEHQGGHAGAPGSGGRARYDPVGSPRGPAAERARRNAAPRLGRQG